MKDNENKLKLERFNLNIRKNCSEVVAQDAQICCAVFVLGGFQP